jgi:zinc/manganese transport system substrate-binding protein
VPQVRPRHLVALLVAAVLAGCGATQAGDGDTLPVVATTTEVGDFVRAVGGDAVTVHQILQPNSDPHDYEPRPADAEAAAGAAVVIASGDGLDDWMRDLVDQAGGDPAVLTIAPDPTPQRVRPGAGDHDDGIGHEHARSGLDPHWWHDPRNAQAAVAAVRDTLVKADPAARATFEANTRRYVAKLRALDAGIARCMGKVPAGERKLVTSHDAFTYLARRYDITVVGALFPAQSAQAQPSAGEVARLAAQIRRERVRAVFPESSINPKLARAIAAQTGATSDLTLYGDTLGPKGSSGATYLTMEQANADAMARGFTGGAQRCTIPGL